MVKWCTVQVLSFDGFHGYFSGSVGVEIRGGVAVYIRDGIKCNICKILVITLKDCG